MKSNFKVGVLTQPLHNNYGGLLQAYAFKEVLKSLNCEVVIVNRVAPEVPRWRLLASRIKTLITGRTVYPKPKMTQQQKYIISKKTRAFKEKYIQEESSEISSMSGLKRLNNQSYQAFIVGSDQCWRPKYSPKIENYFLDFVKDDSQTKRISYAASFGTSDWEFTEKQTQRCKNLITKFDAISVRESSAVDLISRYLGRDDAVHVLDPTMLLDKSCYQSIVERDKCDDIKGELKAYVLDNSPDKIKFIKCIEERLGATQFEIMPKKRLEQDTLTNNNIHEFQFPSPLEWLYGFTKAEFVVTDSFHGTVFSILFNIPFITIVNERRGVARFESLLQMFGLSDRFVTDLNEINVDQFLDTEIDWKSVNQILEQERVKAFKFLKDSVA